MTDLNKHAAEPEKSFKRTLGESALRFLINGVSFAVGYGLVVLVLYVFTH